MIIPWYGKLSNIPDGFALCDGTNGTPDLRDRFLVGIGNSYSLGDTGGMNAVAIQKENLPSDGLSGFGYVINGVYFTWKSAFGKTSGEYDHLSTVDGSNSWKSTAYYSSFDIVLSNNWKGTKMENRPPYFAVYYLMKL